MTGVVCRVRSEPGSKAVTCEKRCALRKKGSHLVTRHLTLDPSAHKTVRSNSQ